MTKKHHKWFSGAIVSLLGAFLLGYVSSAEAEVVDSIVAVVNQEVVTASEVRMATAYNERIGRGNRQSESLASETLQGLITRRLLVQEARRLKIVDISDQDIRNELAKLRKQLGADEAYSRFLRDIDASEQDVGRMLGEQVLVGKFIEKKVGLLVRVPREEAEQYYNAHRDRYRKQRFSEVAKSITLLLLDEKIGKELDRYVAELKGRAEIRMNDARPFQKGNQ